MGAWWLFMSSGYFISGPPIWMPDLVGILYVLAGIACLCFSIWPTRIMYAVAASATLVAWSARLYGSVHSNLQAPSSSVNHVGTLINQTNGITTAMVALAVIFIVIIRPER